MNSRTDFVERNLSYQCATLEMQRDDREGRTLHADSFGYFQSDKQAGSTEPTQEEVRAQQASSPAQTPPES